MNSLKLIAAISGIVFAVALLVAIIATPFAVSGGIDFYNALLDEAEKQKDQHWMETTVDSVVKELTLADSGYYGLITVQESPDNQIHIKNQDFGFSCIVPDVNIRGDKAELNFFWHSDPKLTEENIMQWLSAELYDNYSRQSIIQLPASASLYFAEENMEDLYYHVRLDYKGFANYEELQSQLDGWTAVLESRNAFVDYINVVENQLNQIDNIRYTLADAAESAHNVEVFQLESAESYVDIKERRSNLLKRSYNLRKEFGLQSEEALDSAYLEMNALIVELCEYEKQYDLLSAKVAEARANLNSGNLGVNAQRYESISNSAYDQQVDLDMSISKLREKLQNYLREEFVDVNAAKQEQPGLVYPSEVPPTESTETVEVPMIPETVEVPASPEMPVTEQTETVQP